MLYRNENRLNSDIKSMIDDALAASGLNRWQTVQKFQRAQYSRMEEVIQFFTVDIRRVGWQGRKYLIQDNILYRSERWREERRVQLDFLKSRSSSDTIDTLSAVDVARLLFAFFSGMGGSQVLQAHQMNRLIPKLLRTPAELDDNMKFRIHPGFDLILVYDQEYRIPEKVVDTLEVTTAILENGEVITMPTVTIEGV